MQTPTYAELADVGAVEAVHGGRHRPLQLLLGARHCVLVLLTCYCGDDPVALALLDVMLMHSVDIEREMDSMGANWE